MAPPLHGTSWYGHKFGDVISERLGDVRWNRVHISNYAVTEQGLLLINDPIIQFLRRDDNNRIRIVVGWDGTTTTDAIRRLLGYRIMSEDRVEISIYHTPASAVRKGSPPLYHPKYWVFSNDNEGALLVGSHNLTWSGFSKNIELTLEISGAKRNNVEIDQAIDSVNRFISWDKTRDGEGKVYDLFSTQINSIEDLQEFIGKYPPPQPRRRAPSGNGDEGEDVQDDRAPHFSSALIPPKSRKSIDLDIPDFQIIEDVKDEKKDRGGLVSRIIDIFRRDRREGVEETAGAAAAAVAAAVETDDGGDDQDQDEIPPHAVWWAKLSQTSLCIPGYMREGANRNTAPMYPYFLRLGKGVEPHWINPHDNDTYQEFFKENLIPIGEWEYNEVQPGVFEGTATVEATLRVPNSVDVQTTLVFEWRGQMLDNPLTRTLRRCWLRFSEELKDAVIQGVDRQVWATDSEGNERIIDDGNPNIPVGHHIQLERIGTGEDAEYIVSIVAPPA